MGITVLSLFDGMSCGQIALERLGVEVDNYFACEIDPYAIKVTMANYPKTIQLGDVRELDVASLPKIDLLIGGSPCQNLSFSGNQSGIGSNDLETYLRLKSDEYPFKGQSFLFWEYIRIRKELMEINPNLIWLLENVKMKKAFKEIFDQVAGGNCIEINSALVSAQNRVRNYWSNINGIVQPKDKGIFLKDIIDDSCCDRDKSYCIDANYFKGGSIENYLKKSRRQLVFNRPQCFNKDNTFIIVSDKSNIILATIYKENVKSMIKRNKDGLYVIRNEDGENKEELKLIARKLTVEECEKLQTVPVGYTNHVSNTQRYQMLGNGWTIDVIVHILGFAFNQLNKS